MTEVEPRAVSPLVTVYRWKCLRCTAVGDWTIDELGAVNIGRMHTRLVHR